MEDADQNIEKLLAFKQNNNLLEEKMKTLNIEKKQLESKFKELEQSINVQLMKQKKLESALSLEKSQPTNMNDQLVKQKELEVASLSLEKSQTTQQSKPEVIVFKPDQNNCCFCSCGTSAFEESLQNSR